MGAFNLFRMQDAVTAAIPIAVTSTNVQLDACDTVVVFNNSTQVAYVAIGNVNTVAAVIPTGGTVTGGTLSGHTKGAKPIPPGAEECLAVPHKTAGGGDVWLAVIGAAASGTLFATPGMGA